MILIKLLPLLFLTILSNSTLAATYTATDLADVRCEARCQQRDYAHGWSLPKGGCRCADDFPEHKGKPIVTVSSTLNGRIVRDPLPLFRIEF